MSEGGPFSGTNEALDPMGLRLDAVVRIQNVAFSLNKCILLLSPPVVSCCVSHLFVQSQTVLLKTYFKRFRGVQQTWNQCVDSVVMEVRATYEHRVPGEVFGLITSYKKIYMVFEKSICEKDGVFLVVCVEFIINL